MRFFIGVAAVLMSVMTVAANAESVAGLYQVREELTSQESEVRDEGLQQSFITLVQRLTGQADAAQSSQLAKYHADPQSLISRYGYEENTLIVSFDEQSVLSALRKANLPIWGSNRPAVLAWWLYEDLQGLHLVSDGQVGAQQLHSAAQYYGVPVRLPLGDLDEQLLISNNALSDSEDVRDLAERYSTDAIVIVQQQPESDAQDESDSDTLSAKWQLWIGDERQRGDVSADTQGQLSRAVFAQVNQRLAQRFAIKPGEGESFTVRVADIDLERFVLVERLLEPFAPQLQEVTKDYAQWQVKSSPEQLRAQLALAHLQESTMPVVQPSVEPTFVEGIESAEETEEVAQTVVSERRSNRAGANTQVLYFSW